MMKEEVADVKAELEEDLQSEKKELEEVVNTNVFQNDDLELETPQKVLIDVSQERESEMKLHNMEETEVVERIPHFSSY